MTLDDLYTQIVPTFSPSTQKDLKTAVRVLALALGYPEPTHCPLEVCAQPLPAIYRQLETFLVDQGKGLHTQRNVKNNISRLLRQAEHQGLITLLPPTPTLRFKGKGRPHRPGVDYVSRDGLSLPSTQWPVALKDAFTAFRTWATSPFVHDRDTRWKKRQSTIDSYERLFGSYFGFLYHRCHIHEPTFDHLFDLSFIKQYIHWHVNEKHHRVTLTIHFFLRHVIALTHQYRPNPTLSMQLQTLQRTLPAPVSPLNKVDAWVSLQQLHEIGNLLWPRQRPEAFHHNHATYTGSLTAYNAGLSLMLQLWTYIPYRQRNMREMQLTTNLRHEHGNWHIHFRGEQLKIGQRQGQISTFDLPFPPALVPRLETYLACWRPLLIADTDPPPPHVFLNRAGRPFTLQWLSEATKRAVYRYTGKYWHPHIVRTVWATEYIRTTSDYYSAAIMLNDKLETVIKTYTHLREENAADKAYQWVQQRLNP